MPCNRCTVPHNFDAGAFVCSFTRFVVVVLVVGVGGREHGIHAHALGGRQ